MPDMRYGRRMRFHVVVRYTKGAPAGDEVSLLLSGDEQFRFSRPDWLLILVSLVSKETGAQILLLFWCTWHLRNDSNPW
jgi:hypothetical protein